MPQAYDLKEQVTQLKKLLNGIVFVFTDTVENRDKGTGGHIERMASYIKILIEKMTANKIYSAELDGMDLDLLCSSARLHDIGKINIPDKIISKPERLTTEEFEIMKTHAAEGEKIIDRIILETGYESEYLQNAKLFAGYHHERWDGKGYPHQLSRLSIPIQGRIMAVVDVYDALVSERPYKKPFSAEEAAKIIMDSSGEMFDPLIVEAFYEVRKEIEAVKTR